MITTYGVYGKVELAISLAVGSLGIAVDFEGGSINSRGVIPATYKTNNPIIQKAIENSPEFKHGIIRKIQSVPEKSDLIRAKRMQEAREKADELAKKAAEAANAPAPVPAEKSGSTVPEGEGAAKADEVPEPSALVSEIADEVENVPSGKTEVKVTCQEDAVEYLKANFEGYTSTKLRTKTAVLQAAEAHNLVFVGL